MAHKKYCGVRSDIGDNAVEVLFKVLVDITQRFVKNEDSRVAHYGAAEERALQLSAGETSDGACCEIFHFYQFEDFPYTFFAFRRCHAFGPEQTRSYHFSDSDGEMAVDAVFLRKIAEIRSLGRRCAGFVVVYDFTPRGFKQTENEAEQGSLATSVGACDGYEIASVGCEVHIRQD